MSLKIETIEVSATAGRAGAPSELVRRRLDELRRLRVVTRQDVGRACGTPSAANQFIDAARRSGWLVPIGWGGYKVPDHGTLALMNHIPNPALRQLAAWAAILREHAGRPVAFAAPRLWRDTDLNEARPLPVVLLEASDDVERGTPPQWDAFQLDAQKPEKWRLSVTGKGHVDLLGLASRDVVLLLRASRDPRWGVAARQFEARYGAARVMDDDLPPADPPQLALRGNKTRSIGLGPPHRRRIFAPPWYMDMLRHSLYPVHGGPRGD